MQTTRPEPIGQHPHTVVGGGIVVHPRKPDHSPIIAPTPC